MKREIVSVTVLLIVCCQISAQNVGIGTNTPQTKLHVFIPSIGYGITHEANGVRLATYIDAGGAYFGTRDNAPLHFYTNNGLAQMTVTTSGNVGIGTSFPANRLHIAANSFHAGLVQLNLEEIEEDYARLRFQNSVASRYWEIGALPKTADAEAQMNFYYNNSGVALTLSGNGNVGIGVTNPVQKLQVGGNITATGNMSLPSGSVTANAFQYNNPKTYYYSVPPSAFVSQMINIAQGGHFWTEYSGVSSALKIDGYYSKGFVAPVQLPDGATITSISFYLIDNSSTENLTCALRRRLHQGDIYLTMCSLATIGTPALTTLTTNTIGFPVIDNQNYNYTISIDPELTDHWVNTDLQIKSVRITYTLPGF